MISAAFIGSGVGLALGALYLGAGLGRAVLDHSRAEHIAATAATLRPGPDAAALTLALAAPSVAATVQPASVAESVVARVAEAKPSRARELECLTQAVYFEARGESSRGQQAVATVIMNRVKNPKFPSTICGVVYQGANRRHGCQFSFACDGRAERVVENTAWERARKVAARALSGAVLRDVGGATHFHTTEVAPAWGSQMLRTAQVGLHVFYRFNPSGARRAAPRAPAEAVFASTSTVQPVELRLASAVLAPANDADAPIAAGPLPEPRREARPEVKAAPRLDLPPAAATAPIAKADPAPSRGAAAAS
ncbi:cell wall hydrolase [Phenylobacterium sp. LjRoot219]|uniref:cell wall hydrolase n=1 Tax=Phenylobacterium sp. LjRoot219 TaxID=3342283 RepID=UPI003ECE823C